MPDQQLEWGQTGVCPSCGVVTAHFQLTDTKGKYLHPKAREWVEADLRGSQGRLLVSVCVSESCGALALWIESRSTDDPDKSDIRLVYPQEGIRHPPQEGLEPGEAKLYEEAAAVAPISPRAACALVRALLEALIKRHIVGNGHSIRKDKDRDKNLSELIEMAVKHLDLSSQLKEGLNAIRKRGNAAVHDPYGLTDDTRTEELPWLFQAVDDLVDDLHTKPQRWAGMTQP
ncbi:MAG: DUF4145 domain-containing protein [Acidimicrobiia bacterium]|nr:DUF4145 domain-containing protein [Acidimicrobiia bacterium]MYG59080.1 DUF4145 domain-containing protein [Acidimicrobiia bacterium]MYJ33214.1 DUF4145 domain-containing protein [Acidimicrobiia bacterium]